MRSLGFLLAAVLVVGGARQVAAGDDDHRGCNDPAALAVARAAIDAQCGCDTATSHGEYVSCVARVATRMVFNGTLPRDCRGIVVRCAADSTCGRPGFVTCCRTDSRGHTKCSIKSSAAQCKAPRGGTACVGTQKSCCDACRPGSVCQSTTTTTAAPTTTTTAASTTTTTAASTTTTTAASTTTTTAASTTTTTAPSTTTTTAASTTTTTAPTTTTTTASTTTTTTQPGSPSAAFVS